VDDATLFGVAGSAEPTEGSPVDWGSEVSPVPTKLEFSATDLNNVNRALKKIGEESPHLLRGSTGLTSQFSKDFRTRLNPVVKSLAATIPAKPPLSGLNRNTAKEPYGWKKPRGRVRASKGKRPRPNRPSTAVGIVFKSPRPNSAFYITALARNARSAKGAVFLRNLEQAGFGVKGGLGRSVIPAFKDKDNEVTNIAESVVEDWIKFINRNLKARGRL